MAKLYKLLVNDGNGAEAKPINVMQGVGDKGAPVRIVAQKGVRYELQDSTKAKAAAPDQVRVKRVGKNLTLMFDGSQKPDVVVEDFYAMVSAKDGNLPVLAGLAENGSVYEYIPQDPALSSLTPALADGNTPVLMALGGGALGEAFALSALPLVAAAGGVSGWAVAGAALGAAALGGGGGGGGGGAAADTTAPFADSISGNLKQDETNDTGTKADDGITRNKTPVLVVKAETGATVDVVVNGKTYRATESTTTKGEYEVKISDALDDATYTPSITVTDEAGNKTTRNGVAFTVDNSAGTNPANGTSTDKNPADQNSGANTAIAITAVSEDTGSSATDFITSDKSVLVSGTVANFYNTGASADDAVRVQIFDAYDKLVAQAYATPQSNGSSTWAMTAPTAALVDGDYTIKADIVDAAGNVVKSALPQALKISANYLSAEPDVAIAQEAGYEEDNKTPIKAKNPTGNVLSNDIDVKSDGRLVTGAKVGEEGALKEVATGTSKDNGSSLDGRYGKLLIGADGTYEYILEESKANVLTESDEKTETFTYEVKSITGGTSSATLTVTVKGSNDLAVIGSTSESSFAGTVLAGATTVSGKVTVSDVDADQAAFQTPQKLIGDYGFFTFTQSSGTWIYEVDTSKAAYAALKKDEAATDTLDITSLDGSAIGTVTVTVNGVNDSPQLASVDGLAVSSDNRNISDPQGTKGATRLKDLVGGITDVDSTFAKGIAVTDVSNKGVLWYSVDGGAKWISATPTEATISNGNSLLLAADNSTYVYFQQTSSTTSTFDASSVVTSFIFKAWDTTTGSAGDYVNANSGGGTTAFSAKEQAVLVNDVFNIIGITSPLSVNGGSGFDTLVLNGSGLNLDLTVPSAVSLSRVERVDLKGTGNNTINLNLASVLQADAIDNIHTLYINGDNGDTVSFVSSAGLTTTSIEQTINSVRYNVYHLDSTHDLLIQQAITNVTFS